MNHTANDKPQAMAPINTMKAWRPVLRPISAVIIASQLALVLQPLSALAQDKGQQSINPLAQSQLKRINLLSRDIEAAKAKKQLDAASPADKASADLARIEEISKSLHADLRARGLATLPVKPSNTPGQASDKEAKDVRALGPNIRIETQRSPEQNTALRLADNQRQVQLGELQGLLARQASAQAAITAEFQATRLELEQKKLPAEILARHDEATVQFAQRAAQFNAISQRLQNNPGSTNSPSNQPIAQGNASQTAPKVIAIASPNTSSGNPIQELHAFFAQYQSSKRATSTIDPANPNKLPWSTPEPTKRAPAETKTAWNNHLHKDFYAAQSVKLAQLGSGNIGGIQFTQLPEPSEAPIAADLAETAEVKLTPAIRGKALELGNNPVQIHNWVRNTLEWAPTWGAMQSAQDTLDKRRGNSADIASLEIALLRAAGIPARYQFGTIDITAEQAMNWVGGVSKPEAALQLLGQGGIANRGLVEGGRFAKVRMEHVWVQAYVNWAPSRGARQGGRLTSPETSYPAGTAGSPTATSAQHVNPNGQLNAWVPLDASFKQYSYTAGLDLKTAVPLDANALLTAAQQGATVNANYVQNLNQQGIAEQLRNYQNRLQAAINSSPTGASSTVGDLLGTQAIKTSNPEMLAGTLQYPVVSLGSQVAELPEAMRWKVAYYGYELDGAGGQGNTLINRSFNLSELVSKRVGITYQGATPADQQAIASYRASGATQFPAYAIRVKPLFQIDGNTVVTGEATGMAVDVDWQVTIQPAGTSAFSGQQQIYSAAAGDEMVWAVIGDSVSASQLKAMNFPSTSAGQLHAVGMTYWHQVDVYASMIAKREGAIAQRMPSMGSVSSPMQVQFIWGVPRNAFYSSRMIDVAHSSIGALGMDSAQFQRQLGMRLSYLEGYVFDQVFGRPQGSGISAIRLMQTAAEAGQRIFTLNSGNADQYFGQIQMSAQIREEIINALIMGLEVTIPEATQNISGWQGTAYIAIRPETGAGAYIISGGLRGGAESGDCQLAPSTSPATAASFSPAVLFAAAIIAMYLIASLGVVVIPILVLAAATQSAVAAPVPQLQPPLDAIWNRLSGGSPWPTQFNWPPAYGTPPLPDGVCTPAQKAILQLAQDAACNNSLARESCDSATQNCGLMVDKLRAKEACIAARLDVMNTCYLGGDSGHWQQIEQKMKEINKCTKCISANIAAGGQCPIP